jgi:hypothetical protein
MIEALITLISLSASNGYGNKETYIAAVESAINDFKAILMIPNFRNRNIMVLRKMLKITFSIY